MTTPIFVGDTQAIDVVTITQVDPAGPQVLCRHGDGSATYSSQGGWQYTKRPKRAAMSEYMGHDPWILTVPLVFSYDPPGTKPTANDNSVVESGLQILEAIYRNHVGPRQEPAVVTLTCPLIPFTGFQWNIQDWQETAVYRDEQGQRYYTALNITFNQYVPADLIDVTSTSPAQQIASASQTACSVYTVKYRDTLWSIAQKQLGDVNQWKLLSTMNNIRDPDAITEGQLLRLP